MTDQQHKPVRIDHPSGVPFEARAAGLDEGGPPLPDWWADPRESLEKIAYDLEREAERTRDQIPPPRQPAGRPKVNVVLPARGKPADAQGMAAVARLAGRLRAEGLDAKAVTRTRGDGTAVAEVSVAHGQERRAVDLLNAWAKRG